VLREQESRDLDRSVIGDLWRHTLGQIPTNYGRLVYLASLRDPDTGKYRHHGLTAVFGRVESSAALAESHLNLFCEWLQSPIAERFADLSRYLESLDTRREKIVRNWRRTRAYRNSVPLAAREADRILFYADMDAMLMILKNSSVAESLPPGSSQHA